MTKRTAPAIKNAPGLTWRARINDRWEARWQARTDIVQMGFVPKSYQLYVGPLPDAATGARLAERCRMFQEAMHTWVAARKPTAAAYNGMLCTLIECYLSDPESTFHSARYATKKNYTYLCKRLIEDRGSALVTEIKYRDLKAWHRDWSSEGRITMAHGLFAMLRTVIGFGTTILERDECGKLQAILHGMKIPQGKARTTWVNADQASAIRAMAHQLGRPSVALAQAVQFECILRQKDVIGEYVPNGEPGVSDVFDGNKKWLRGVRWEEIDGELVLDHVTSKRDKRLAVPLTKATMVMEEFARQFPDGIPKQGPIVISEATGLPYTDHEFRRQWRMIAREAGVPDNVFNMDSRSGAISEATDAGADLEHVRHAATHGDISMTQRYSRNSQKKIENVMDARAAHRKTGTDRENND